MRPKPIGGDAGPALARTSAGATEALSFEFIAKYSVYKGYLPHWHFGLGDYESKESFIWLEYECAKKKPTRVLIQVEGPKGSMMSEWNGAKEGLFRETLAALEDVRAAVPKGWKVDRGPKSSTKDVRGHQCTSVIVVQPCAPSDADWREDARQAIALVHSEVGMIFEAAWQRWWDRFGRDL